MLVDDSVVDCAAPVVDWETGLGQAVLLEGLPAISVSHSFDTELGSQPMNHQQEIANGIPGTETQSPFILSVIKGIKFFGHSIVYISKQASMPMFHPDLLPVANLKNCKTA